MQPSWVEVAMGYLLVGSLLVGLPIIFFVVTFLPGLMRTTGEAIGAKAIGAKAIGSEASEQASQQDLPASNLRHGSQRKVPDQLNAPAR